MDIVSQLVKTEFSQCLAKPHSNPFSVFLTLLSWNYLSWIVAWRRKAYTRKAFIFLK